MGKNLYCNTKIVLCQLGQWAARLCRNTGPRHGQPGHDTALGAADARVGALGEQWARGRRAQLEVGARAAKLQAGRVANGAHGRRSAGCARSAATRPGGPATTRPRARGLRAQAGPAGLVGCSCTRLCFSTLFSTR